MAFRVFMAYYILAGVTIGLLTTHFGVETSGGVILGVFMPFAGLMLLLIFVMIAVFFENLS